MAYRPFHSSAADSESKAWCGLGCGQGIRFCQEIIKMASKWDKELARDVCAWIKSGTGATVPSEDPTDFAEALNDGQTLCNLANKIQPGAIKKINKMKMPFMQMENIVFFNEFMRAYGVQSDYLFVTVDLYEKQNVPQVLIGLNALKCKVEGKNVKL